MRFDQTVLLYVNNVWLVKKLALTGLLIVNKKSNY